MFTTDIDENEFFELTSTGHNYQFLYKKSIVKFYRCTKCKFRVLVSSDGSVDDPDSITWVGGRSSRLEMTCNELLVENLLDE